MTDTTFARFFRRLDNMTFAGRGSDFVVESAGGLDVENGIGWGKVAIPAYDNDRRAALAQIQPGDVCISWTIAPYNDYDHRPLSVACFIVETRQYKDGKYEVSGPDFIKELAEYPTIAPVGELAEVVVGAVSMGTRLNRTPDPDVYVDLEAAYPPFFGITNDETVVTPGGPEKRNILFTTYLNVQVTDTFHYTFADGEVFSTTVTGVSDERTRVEIGNALPQTLPAAANVYFQSTRLRVTDGSALEAGALLFYTPAVTPGGPNPPPSGNLLIDHIDEGDGDAADYVYSADPIMHLIAANTGVTQFQYTKPTTSDVALLFRNSTFNQWQVSRSPYATIGTAYAPNDESVWDVLLAISEITDYRFRRYFRGWASGGAQHILPPTREIQYYVAGDPAGTATRIALGTENRIAADYGEVLHLETDDITEIVTHLIPYGGGSGSGKFDIGGASFITVLNDPLYIGRIGHGIVNNKHYIYNLELGPQRDNWRTETFSHISPLDNTSFDSRREAATQLLVAACDWLLARNVGDRSYVAEVFTLAEPRPGDLADLNYEGVEAIGPISETGLIITQVEHSVSPDDGYRRTRLTMSREGRPRRTGENDLAKVVLDLQRTMQRANFGSRGDARISADTLEFGQDANITSRTGNVILKSTEGDVTIRSETGDVFIDGNAIDVTGDVLASGIIRSEAGFVLPDSIAPHDWALTAVTVRNIPRVIATWQERRA